MKRCVLCGSTRDVTNHHVGGQNFIAWFTMPLCAPCQVVFHARQRAALIDLGSTPNPLMRFVRALKMTVLFMWILLDMLEKQIDADMLKAKSSGRSQGGC